MKQPLVVLCTCPSTEVATKIAEHLLNQELTACVNLLPNVTSIYRWQGEICTDAEVQLLIKTNKDNLPALETTICQHHPYEVPEIISLPIDWGHRPYMEWLNHNC